MMKRTRLKMSSRTQYQQLRHLNDDAEWKVLAERPFEQQKYIWLDKVEKVIKDITLRMKTP